MRNTVFCLALLSCSVFAGKSDLDAYLGSGKERIVKDYAWMSARTLYIGVVDDGTRRDGFAQYMCLKAAELDVRVELIKIVDISTLVKTGKFHEIGRSYC